jgi:hypothetical protein
LGGGATHAAVVASFDAPLTDIATAWQHPSDAARIVLTP